MEESNDATKKQYQFDLDRELLREAATVILAVRTKSEEEAQQFQDLEKYNLKLSPHLVTNLGLPFKTTLTLISFTRLDSEEEIIVL